MENRDRKLLIPGETCWRVEKSHRAALLIDGAAYFEALRDSLRKARRSVFIVGWDIDSRMRLVGASGEADDGLPEALGPFLTDLVAQRPDLKIHLLLWDYSLLYALDREPLPSINLDWKTPEQISVCLDNVLPVGASHHQKIVVVDDAVAYCGGLDLTIRRWDTSAHGMGDERRVDPAGEIYRPFHDMQMVMDSDAAAALAELVRRRWQNAACERPIEFKPVGDPWPSHVDADFTDIELGIARTVPAYDGEDEVREVEALYTRAIEAAERSIYIESQYLTAEHVATSLVDRLTSNDRLEAVIVAPNVHHSWLEERSMNAGRRRVMARLEDAGVLDRVRLVYPAVPDDDTGEGVMVHAKFMIVDDRILRVGSSNLNNRSMGMDSECDVALEAGDPADRRRVTQIRNRLLAEHLAVEADDVAAAVEKHGSLLRAVDDLSEGERTLRPIDLTDVPQDEMSLAVSQVADPERPIATPNFAGDLFGATVVKNAPARISKLILAGAVVLALIAVWRLTPAAELADTDALASLLQELGGDAWMPLLIPAIFLVGGLIVFPVTVLIAVTGMMFNPLSAFAYGLGGSLLSAVVTYFIGYKLGRGPLRGFAGRRVNRISRALARQGVLSVMALRMVPIAPFSVINLVAGASHIRTLDFILGTTLGMAPGILVISLLGRQLVRILNDPATGEIVVFGLGLCGWVALSALLQVIAKKLRAERDG